MSRPSHRFITGVLILSTLLWNPAVYAQQPATPEKGLASDSSGAEAKEGARVDLRYMTSKPFMGGILYPRRVLTAPSMEMLPTEVLTAASLQKLGVDPLDIESILFFSELPPGLPRPTGPPKIGFVARFAKPYDKQQVLETIPFKKEEVKAEGHTYYRLQIDHEKAFVAMPDAKTIIGGTEVAAGEMFQAKGNSYNNLLTQKLRSYGSQNDITVAAIVSPMRDLLNQQIAAAPKLPPPFEAFKQIPNKLDALILHANLVSEAGSALVLQAKDEAAAADLQEMANTAITVGRQMALANIQKEMKVDENDPVAVATQAWITRISAVIADSLRPSVDGSLVVFDWSIGDIQQGGTELAIIGVLMALLLPAIQAARNAARRTASMNNMRQLCVAMHGYHAQHNHFPAYANFDQNGKPLLSWRVHLLPYLDQQQLYQQFKLDEPWDSEHNKKLIRRMPGIYRNPYSDSLEKTNYLVPTGEDTFFAGKKGLELKQATDGLSNTILIVEGDLKKSAIWTRPEDLSFNPTEPLAGVSKIHSAGFNVAFADGSVRFINHKIDPKLFKALITPHGGESQQLPR